MRWIVMGVLVISLLSLVYIAVKKKLGLGWLTIFGTHMVLASLGIYLVNFSGLITSVYIPLNPVTIGTVMVLGLPGVGLLYGFKLFLISS